MAAAHKVVVRLTAEQRTALEKIAHTGLSAVARQGLDRRLPDQETLAGEVAAWQAKRDAAAVTIDWQFTTADARTKLKRLYPMVEITNQPQ